MVDYAQSVKNIQMALDEPERYCCSGRCPDTNWGGVDRVHYRGSECPEFSKSELEGYLSKVSPKT